MHKRFHINESVIYMSKKYALCNLTIDKEKQKKKKKGYNLWRHKKKKKMKLKRTKLLL